MTDDERRMFNVIAGFLDQDALGHAGWTTPQDGARQLMVLLGYPAFKAALVAPAPRHVSQHDLDLTEALRALGADASGIG